MKRKYSLSDIEKLASGWMAEVASGDEPDEGSFSDSATLFSFLATHDSQWAFLKACMRHAKSDDQQLCVAVGPFEHLFGNHGDLYISQLEALGEADESHRDMISWAYRHGMSDDVWLRVRKLRSKELD